MKIVIPATWLLFRLLSTLPNLSSLVLSPLPPDAPKLQLCLLSQSAAPRVRELNLSRLPPKSPSVLTPSSPPFQSGYQFIFTGSSAINPSNETPRVDLFEVIGLIDRDSFFQLLLTDLSLPMFSSLFSSRWLLNRLSLFTGTFGGKQVTSEAAVMLYPYSNDLCYL